MRTRHGSTAGLLVMVLAGAAACDFGFEDKSAIIDLRVLGMQNSPSELSVDEAGAATAPISVRVLAVDPRPDHQGPVAWRVRMCVNDDIASNGSGYGGILNGNLVSRGSCPPDAPLIAEGNSTVDAIAFDFVTPAAILQRITADYTLPLGVPAALQLEIAPEGSPPEIAVKRMIYSRAVTEASGDPACDEHPWVPNRNPSLPGLTVAHEIDDEGKPVDPVPFPESLPYPVPLGGKIYLLPDDAAAQAEVYRARYVDRATLQLRTGCYQEVLRYSFYATAGTFAPSTSSTFINPALDAFHVHLESLYEAPREMPANPLVRVFVVARDERAGETWIERRLVLVAP